MFRFCYRCGEGGDGDAGLSADADFFEILISDAFPYKLIHRHSLLDQNGKDACSRVVIKRIEARYEGVQILRPADFSM
jgi:hypothetical protein